jgi:hypothetical protein
LKILLSIDDTDSLDSPGTGQHLDVLAKILRYHGLVKHYSHISRHQLYLHKEISYTSHNSAMCLRADADGERVVDLIHFARQYLIQASAPDANPGLCVAHGNLEKIGEQLIDYGHRAKEKLVTQAEARSVAEKVRVHLSGYGVSGNGLIGALAAVGLRLHGTDGRIRGWVNFGRKGEVVACEGFCRNPYVDAVVDVKKNFKRLSAKNQIEISEEKIKTILVNNKMVVPVRKSKSSSSEYITLTKYEAKIF